MRKMKIGLALGSGAARGWSHIGVIKALKQTGIDIGTILAMLHRPVIISMVKLCCWAVYWGAVVRRWGAKSPSNLCNN
ncbi:hypothetical protein MJL13_22225, partial [Salmonella enterica subsp. enterica serovar Cerro]|nr:hypothetical protein [Salmonella enterica subsp. enterica serovar Cerro]